jgi:hypothetical protein
LLGLPGIGVGGREFAMPDPGHPFILACALAIGVCSVRGGGVAVLKEQTFHHDSSAKPVVYSRIIDSRGPYLRIVSGTGNVDILRTKLAGRIELPEGVPASIMEEKDLAPVRETQEAVRAFTVRYPRSAPVLEKLAGELAGHVSRFEAGEVRFEGAWISKEAFAAVLADRKLEEETRKRESDEHERREVEKWAMQAAQRDRDIGTPEPSAPRQPEAPTELSEAIEPLWSSDLEGARFAVKNLTALASRQNGAPKFRSERLLTAVRNLFLAEARLSQRVLASTAESKTAAMHEQNAKKWLKPNAFGTVNTEASRDSREKAKAIRKRVAEDLALRRQELLDQLRESDIVTAELHNLGEHRVTLIFGRTVRAVGKRHFTAGEFQSAFPDESLAAIRKRIISNGPATSSQ